MVRKMSRSNEPAFADRSRHASLENDPAKASEMRAFVGSYLEASEIPADVSDEVLMAVGEVVANSCRHGRAPSKPGVVDLLCERDDDLIRIRISDDGPGFDVAGVLREGVPDILSQGGRGFFLMRQLMDKVDVRSDRSGTTVILERQLPK
jgi:anti-sigma regulatory factor (Ser/Thr protein kinase)